MNKYEAVATKVLAEVEATIGAPVKVEHWKSSRPYSGRAFSQSYRVIVPEPKSDISLNTYLHELGHLVNRIKPSCLNEYAACMFAIDKMRDNGIPVSKKIKRHHNWYIAYSLAQALNRNLKAIPAELKPFRKYLRQGEAHIIYGDGRRKVKAVYRADMSKC